MPRVGLTHDRVVAEAAAFVDEFGLSQLNVSALATRLGVRQPSLYKHIDGIAALQRSISIAAKSDIAELMARAAVGRARGDALVAMCAAYRAWARQHPGRYAAAQTAPVPGDVEDEKVSSAAVEVLFDVLGGFGLAADDAVDAIRALRACLHGFVALETTGGFGLPTDIDRSFDRMVNGLVDSLSRWAAHET